MLHRAEATFGRMKTPSRMDRALLQSLLRELAALRLGFSAFAGDASDAIGRLLNFYNPTGTLSGVTTVAIIIWLVSWIVLHRLWDLRAVSMATINALAFAGLIVGFLLTFPPFMDLLQGK